MKVIVYNFTDEMIPGGTPNPPLRRVVDAPFTSKSHFGLLAVRCLSYMGWGSPLFFVFFLFVCFESKNWIQIRGVSRQLQISSLINVRFTR